MDNGIYGFYICYFTNFLSWTHITFRTRREKQHTPELYTQADLKPSASGAMLEGAQNLGVNF